MTFRTKKGLYVLTKGLGLSVVGLLIFNFLLVIRYFFGKPGFDYFLFNISIFGLLVMLGTLSRVLSKAFNLTDQEETFLKSIKVPLKKAELELCLRNLNHDYGIEIKEIVENESYRLSFEKSPNYIMALYVHDDLIESLNRISEDWLNLKLELTKPCEGEIYWKDENSYFYTSDLIVDQANRLLNEKSKNFGFYQISSRNIESRQYIGLFSSDFEKLNKLSENFIPEMGYYPQELTIAPL